MSNFINNEKPTKSSTKKLLENLSAEELHDSLSAEQIEKLSQILKHQESNTINSGSMSDWSDTINNDSPYKRDPRKVFRCDSKETLKKEEALCQEFLKWFKNLQIKKPELGDEDREAVYKRYKIRSASFCIDV